MKSFAKLALGFFLFCLLMFFLVYRFGPSSVREALRSGESPVGQLGSDANTQSPGPPPESK